MQEAMSKADPKALDIIYKNRHNEEWSDTMQHVSQYLGDTDIVRDLANLYILEHLGIFDRTARRAKDKMSKEVADRVLWYMVFACVGEARYAGDLRYGWDNLSPLALAIAGGDRNRSRGMAWRAAVELAEHYGKAAVLEACLECFADMDWQGAGSVGGPNWAKIASLALEYASGRGGSPMYWLDQVVDIVHNGGWAMNKYYVGQTKNVGYDPNVFRYAEGGPEDFIQYAELSLQMVLDTKRDNALALIPYIELYPEVARAVARAKKRGLIEH